MTMNDDHEVFDDARVYIDDDGHVTAVGNPAARPPGFEQAPEIQTGGVIYPGLIDLHSHIAYNTLPLWEARGVPYNHHDAWTSEQHPPAYATAVSWPQKVLGQAAAEAVLKYVGVKALVGGTTSIQGAPHITHPVEAG